MDKSDLMARIEQEKELCEQAFKNETFGDSLKEMSSDELVVLKNTLQMTQDQFLISPDATVRFDSHRVMRKLKKELEQAKIIAFRRELTPVIEKAVQNGTFGDELDNLTGPAKSRLLSILVLFPIEDQNIRARLMQEASYAEREAFAEAIDRPVEQVEPSLLASGFGNRVDDTLR